MWFSINRGIKIDSSGKLIFKCLWEHRARVWEHRARIWEHRARIESTVCMGNKAGGIFKVFPRRLTSGRGDF